MHLEINTLSLVIFKHIYKYYTGIMTDSLLQKPTKIQKATSTRQTEM